MMIKEGRWLERPVSWPSRFLSHRGAYCFSLLSFSSAAKSSVRALKQPSSRFCSLRHLGEMTRPWMGALGLHGPYLRMVSFLSTTAGVGGDKTPRDPPRAQLPALSHSSWQECLLSGAHRAGPVGLMPFPTCPAGLLGAEEKTSAPPECAHVSGGNGMPFFPGLQ